jgi:hypothetical protein
MNAETWKTWSSDKSRISDGYVFATPDERRRYIGMLLRDRPRWVRENPERCRRIEDVQQEAAQQLAPPVKSEINVEPVPAGPNNQTPSSEVRKDRDDEDAVAWRVCSAQGQPLHFCDVRDASAFHPIATKSRTSRHFRFGPVD